MFYQTNLQQRGQNLEKSTVMWTRPATVEQQRYYSKHAPERRVYGWIMTMMQMGHAMLAFAAWNAVYGWALDKFTWLHILVPVLAAFTLMSLHVLFRTTWETYWYDKLDNDPKTDSPIIVPILIIIGLLGCEVYGAGKFLESKVAVAKVIDADPISARHEDELANLRRQFSQDSFRIIGVYAPKIRAVALPYQAKINRMKGTTAKDYAEAQWIKAQIKSIQSQCDQAIAPVLALQAEALTTASNGISARIKSAYERHERSLTEVENKNRHEDTRYQAEMNQTGTLSWVISIFLLSIIAVLGYRRVRINVMSGILPLRHYTVLDAHGSAAERIWTALSDAMNRRWLQFAVWLHRALSPNHALTSFDGTVVTRPGEYNTPEGFLQGATPPQQHTQTEATRAMLDKLAHTTATKPAPDQFASEANQPLQPKSNHRDMPVLEKPETAPPKSTPMDAVEAQAQLRTILTEGLRLSNVLHGQGPKEVKALAHTALYGESALLQSLKDKNLVWGDDLNGVFCAGMVGSGQYYPVESLLSLPYITFPPQETQENGYILFKQTGELFKQIRNAQGKVIGLEYKGPRMEHPTTLSYSQVVSRISSYRNNTGRRDETRIKMLEVWTAALELFEFPKEDAGLVPIYEAAQS